MKTIYKCEVCGKEFPDWEECRNHEKVCEETHATGIRLAKELNTAVKNADEQGGARVGASWCDDRNIYRFKGADYDPAARVVRLDIDTDDVLGRKEEAADNGND